MSKKEEITACPGCGCEPEIKRSIIDTNTKKFVGYVCTCGAQVINGIIAMWDPL